MNLKQTRLPPVATYLRELQEKGREAHLPLLQNMAKARFMELA